MNDSVTLMLSLTLYKIVTVGAGLAFAFMGYKLFIHGIFNEAGELRTNWEKKSLVLRKAAPGTFFAFFGTVIVAVALWRGLTFEPVDGRAFRLIPVTSAGASGGAERSREETLEGGQRAAVASNLQEPVQPAYSGTGSLPSGTFGSGKKASAVVSEEERKRALEDIVVLNGFIDELERQSGETGQAKLTVVVADKDEALGVGRRAKLALMLDVWSEEWGDPEEFRNWVNYEPGYSYTEPPQGIAAAAAIFKGETK